MTYYILRDDIYIWLSQFSGPLATDTIVEQRPMLFADEGKVLTRNGEMVGKGIWTADFSGYEEVDEVEEEVIEEEQEFTEGIDNGREN